MRQIVRANKLLQPPIPGPARNRPKVPNLGFQHLSGIGPDPEFWQSARIRELRETAYFLELSNSWEMPKNTKSGNSSNSAKTEKTGNWPISGMCTNRGLSRILGSQTPEFASPGRGPQNCPPGPRNCPVWGGYPPELAWSKGKYAVFCCFLLNSTEFREFPVGGPQKRVFRYPGSKGNFVVSGTPKSAKPGNRPKPGQTGPRPPIPGFQGLQTPNSGPRPGRANFSLSGSYQGWLVTKQYIIPDFLVRFRAFLP